VRKVATSGVITTVAGGGCCSLGDGGPATSAQLSNPRSVKVDAGNLYIADTSNARIRVVSSAGIITTLAGNGTSGYSGDGGPAINAQLSIPIGLAVDGAGNLYIADTNNQRIRKVATNGAITTVAGTGSSGFSGDGGPATSAQVNCPDGVAADASGKLYIADTCNSRIRMVSSTGTISTLAGTGNSGYSGDGGPAIDAQLNSPQDVIADANGTLYVSDSNDNAVRLLTPVGTQPVLSVTSAHSGSFTAGQTGTYTVTVANGASSGATSGVMTVTEILPPSLTLVSMAGTGWTCAVTACARSDSWTGGSALPAITVTVNVGLTAYPQVTNQVTVTGGGAAVTGTEDFTLVLPFAPPALSVTKAHSGVFAQGQSNAAYTVTVSNAGGAASTSGTVTVTETVPAGMTLVSMAGSGWSCASGGTTCTTTNLLAGGAGYPAITVTVNVASNAPSLLTNHVSVSGGGSGPAPAGDLTLVGSQSLRFVPITPCRIADTRNPNGPFGGPILGAAISRDFNIPASACGIPANAAAYSLNLTVVPLGPLGYLSVWPTGQSQPLVSTRNSLDGRIKANAAIVPAGVNGAVTLFASDSTHAIIDINGYFVPASGAQNLAFYPVTPCRVADTRNPTGTFGGPALAPAVARTFPVPASTCGIPASAQAYAFNMTVVPSGSLGFLTTWPAGTARPGVSTLNALTGVVTSNAAIVPAGVNGGITVYATDTTDLIIDISGYFAPPGVGSLDFYTANPCRVLDTRRPVGPLGGPIMGAGETRSFSVPSSTCGIPGTAQAYSLNATVVPPGALSYLALWGSGAKPYVSTLNSLDGTIVSNAALVPAGASGEVTAYTTDLSHLILDINGYFQ